MEISCSSKSVLSPTRGVTLAYSTLEHPTSPSMANRRQTRSKSEDESDKPAESQSSNNVGPIPNWAQSRCMRASAVLAVKPSKVFCWVGSLALGQKHM